jgi:5-methylcytosine-specific restriction protein A
MRFKGGNLAIRDHDCNGKSLLLFEALGKSKPVRFMGQFSCQTWDTFQGVDRNGDMRECIRFHLVRCEHDVVPAEKIEVATNKDTSIELLRKRAFDAAVPKQSKNWNDAPRVYRNRSKAVRDYVLARADGVCELTGKPAPFLTASGQPYLEVHHTRRLSDEGPDDPRFVAAICPTVHREIHFGKNGEELNRQLIRQLEIIEPHSKG